MRVLGTFVLPQGITVNSFAIIIYFDRLQVFYRRNTITAIIKLIEPLHNRHNYTPNNHTTTLVTITSRKSLNPIIPFILSQEQFRPYLNTSLKFQPRLPINSILSSKSYSTLSTSTSSIKKFKSKSKSNTMATVATKTATPVMLPSISMSQDISRAMTASNQKTEKTRSILIDGMPPAPPPSPVAFSKGKTCYNNIPSLSLE
ncbi:hypothetical protein ACN38_g625 [Penicillium nordicum]|uniref:Uncharacterized protein n=1 Tax=Penicillium nordicum TaxID=229535 RepID=A0A0M8PGV7_9EURO|nr:hypothetical protein ACN38_g625 [Penicillium nordicum]